MGLDVKRIRKVREAKGKPEVAEHPAVKWVKFGVALVLYLVFLVWLESWLGLVVVPFIYDYYISKKIRWTWWKELESDAGRMIMSWVDALVFALVAVYFVNNFFFQNYQIPSSSLEKSLLTGDYLMVSKMSYGPRIPQTPLTMPLTQHTLPVLDCKSYIEWPQWKYRRAKGFGKVEWGDIVVFNYPAGDTVATHFNGDFYDLCVQLAQQYVYEQGGVLPEMSSLGVMEQRAMYEQLYSIGKQIVKAQPDQYGEIVVRPADRRENYVKRCVGLPGQTLEIRKKIIYIDGKEMPTPTRAQFNYKVYTKNGQAFGDELSNQLELSDQDRAEWARNREFGIPLTKAAHDELLKHTELVDSIVEICDGRFGNVYPLNHDYGWTRDTYGPVHIPAKGETIKLTQDNIAIYERPIRTYEGNDLEVREDGIFINGERATEYTFKMDYYWMMGDNRHNSADSRYWGFVPEDHIVGKPLFIWWSVSPDTNPVSRIRWSRLFTSVDNIK